MLQISPSLHLMSPFFRHYLLSLCPRWFVSPWRRDISSSFTLICFQLPFSVSALGCMNFFFLFFFSKPFPDQHPSFPVSTATAALRKRVGATDASPRHIQTLHAHTAKWLLLFTETFLRNASDSVRGPVQYIYTMPHGCVVHCR